MGGDEDYDFAAGFEAFKERLAMAEFTKVAGFPSEEFTRDAVEALLEKRLSELKRFVPGHPNLGTDDLVAYAKIKRRELDTAISNYEACLTWLKGVEACQKSP